MNAGVRTFGNKQTGNFLSPSTKTSLITSPADHKTHCQLKGTIKFDSTITIAR